MPLKSSDTLAEAETIIRWDDTNGPAILWTASPKVRKEWAACGFEPTAVHSGGWRTEVPVDRITYKTLKKAK